MTPTADMQTVLDEFAKLGPIPLADVTPEVARQLPPIADAAVAAAGHSTVKRAMAPFPMPVSKIEHRFIPSADGDVLARIYTPEGNGPMPVVLYFHGGGWVIATLDTYDASCRALATMAKCIIVSVAYRQAPEHPFPAAADDAIAAYRWVLQNAETIGGDRGRIAVAGESAGGNLATVTALRARDEGLPLPLHQLLVYPVTDAWFDTPSYNEYTDPKLPLNKAGMQWFWKHYLGEGASDAGSHPYASPARADLQGLPPATVVLAEIDPLRSEGEQYAQKLGNAGVPTQMKLYSGVTHEFFGMAAAVGEAKDAVEYASQRLTDAFEGKLAA